MGYTTRNKLEKIEIGADVDTWGEAEHDMLDRLDEALDGVLDLTVSGDRTIVYANDSTDEGHYAVFNVTAGSGGRIIIGNIQAAYYVHNLSSGNVVVTCNASGHEATVASGELSVVFCDGSNNVYQLGFGSNLKSYIDAGDAASQAYAASLAFTANAGNLPAQAGNSGKFVTTNGTTASWAAISTSNVTGLNAQLTSIQNFAIAAAAIL